jgi:hypothetical protein
VTISPLLASGGPSLSDIFGRIGIVFAAVFSSGFFVAVVGRLLLLAAVPRRQRDQPQTRLLRLRDNMLVLMWGFAGLLLWYLLASILLQKTWPQ